MSERENSDGLRPLIEAFGIIPDKLTFHRKDTVQEVAKRTKRLLKTAKGPVRPIPLKFFVPLLEKASLEDASDEKIIDMWANLIATAATSRVELIGQYTEVLAGITSDQARTLDKIVGEISDTDITTDHYLDTYSLLNQSGIPGVLERYRNEKTPKKFMNKILRELKVIGVIIDTLAVYSNDDGLEDQFSLDPKGVYSDEIFFEFENLRRLNILEKVEIWRAKVGNYDVDLHYYLMTPVGIDLYACCNPDLIRRAT